LKSNNLLLLISAVLALCLQGGAQSEVQPEVAARHALDVLLAAKYADFEPLLTPEAKQKLTPDFLRNQVTPEISGYGKMEEIGHPISAQSGKRTLVSFPVRFSKTSINIQLTVAESGQIAGLYFRNANDPLPPMWERPAYSKPGAFHERDVTVGSDDWKLPGTFTVPAGKSPFPVVVLVQGPGPNDRDESIYNTRIFADIAEGLASKGIAVLRYDKRTKVYAPQMTAMSYTLQDETIEDAVRALRLAAAQPESDPKRVFVLGHSLGGYAVPRIAKQYGKLAGAIVLAGNARPIEDVSVAQVEFMLKAKGGATPDEQKRLDLMKAEAARIKNLGDGKENSPILLGLPAAYYLDLKNYNPVAETRALSIPFLILHGERDFQVTDEDLKLWKAGLASDKNVTLKSYPALNHLFITGDGPPSPMDYRKAGNVSPVIIDDISDWLLHVKHK
jgi:dienelactone hydrolase